LEGLCICNTASSSLSFVDLETHEHTLCPLVIGQCPSGPHGMSFWEDYIITANSYGNSLSLVSIKSKKEVENLYVGSHPNDIKVFRNKGYILCGESNCLIIFDLVNRRIMKEIFIGIYPHFMHINAEGKSVLANMDSNEVTIFNCENDEKVFTVSVGETPTKCIITDDGRSILVCESYLGLMVKGKISKYSLENGKKISETIVGYGPVDFYCTKEYIYVSNFEEGTIGYINNKNNEYENVKIGGMPRGVIKINNDIYVGDNYKNRLLIIDEKKKVKKTITLGKEPAAIVYYKLLN